MSLFLDDGDVRLFQGDALEVLRSMPDGSVDCCITSPPYFGLRDYGTGTWEGGNPDCDHQRPSIEGKMSSSTLESRASNQNHEREGYKDVCGKCGATRTDQQLGLEPDPQTYISRMVEVFREVRRVLSVSGTCWVNMGDSYASVSGSGLQGENGQMATRTVAQVRDNKAAAEMGAPRRPPGVHGLKPKDLCGIPWMLAFALRDDGWFLRSDIVWSKPNPMPESVTDRPTKSHEYVFLLSKRPRYFFDQEAVREKADEPTRRPTEFRGGNVYSSFDNTNGGQRTGTYAENESTGRNARSVWEIPTQPYPEAHFATYPEELVRRCILAGTSERGCCPECGAPWVRIIERNNPSLHAADDDKRGWANTHSKTSNAQSSKSLHRNPGGVYSSAVDKGWTPSCEHVALPVPCTVLDPFLGSGTTAYVARKHGRNCIGIELNPAYCELAARRLQQLSLLAAGESGNA